MTYPEALEAISNLLPRAWRLGLERMQEFVQAAGLEPALNLNYIQVAGTNGKGSVTAYLQSLLVEQGYRTGAYFSPYVYDPRERVQLGRSLISKQDFTALVSRLLPIAKQLDEHGEGMGPTEFEFKTALGLAAWLHAKCEWVALEVGLGGRLDATSIVTPRCGVIVSIGMDHMSVLGNSLEEIAAEKAGILKPGMPLVLGSMLPGPREVILKIADERECPVWEFGKEVRLEVARGGLRVQTPGRTYSELVPGLQGHSQDHNMALGVAALELSGALRSPDSVAAGVERTRIFGRFERRKVDEKLVVLDGAHNADAAENLALSLREADLKDLTLVFGMLEGHDTEAMIRPILPFLREVVLAPIHFHRAISPEMMQRRLAAIQPDLKTTLCGSTEESIETALDRCNGCVLVTGSFYLVGEIGNALSLREERSR